MKDPIVTNEKLLHHRKFREISLQIYRTSETKYVLLVTRLPEVERNH